MTEQTSQDSGMYRIGDWVLDVACCRLRRGREERVLEPKELGVLVKLAEAAPAFVTADDLLNEVWPDTVVVSNALHQVVRHLRKSLQSEPGCRYIETLPRRGYRLATPVSRFSADTVRVLVGPIRSLDGDEWLSAALRDEIVHRLSRISMFSIQAIASELPEVPDHASTKRVLGTVRRTSERESRICLQLSEAGNGELLWCDSFEVAPDTATANLVMVAEKLAQASKLVLQPFRTHRGGVSASSSEPAVRSHLKGLIALGKARAACFEEAISCFNQAITIDPEFAAAWIGKAQAYLRYSNYGRMERRKAWEMVRAFTERALSMDAELPSAQLMLADLDLYDGAFSAAHQRLARFRDGHPEYDHVGVVQHL